MTQYEGMFLFDNTVAHEWPSMEQEVRRLCERVGAKLKVCLKFDERKLAYEIRGRKRGTYVLTYFEAPPEKMREMERDAQLSESILRALFLRREIKPEKLAELQAHPADQPLKPLAAERRDDHGDRYGGYGGGRWGERAPRDDRAPRTERPAEEGAPIVDDV